MGRDPDPTRSRDHVALSVFAERRLRERRPAGVAELLGDVRDPPLPTLGALPIDEFLPTFESWRTGAPLEVIGIESVHDDHCTR
jgi:hypothetical protein